MAFNDSSQIEQDIRTIQDNIALLEKQYVEFFAGAISAEPKPLLIQTEALVRKWWGRPISNAQLRFQVQNLVQRFNSYKEKWTRQTRLKTIADSEEESPEKWEKQMHMERKKRTTKNRGRGSVLKRRT